MQAGTTVTQGTETQVPPGGQLEFVRIAVTLPKELDRALEMEAARRDKTKSRMVAKAIEAYLAQSA